MRRIADHFLDREGERVGRLAGGVNGGWDGAHPLASFDPSRRRNVASPRRGGRPCPLAPRRKRPQVIVTCGHFVRRLLGGGRPTGLPQQRGLVSAGSVPSQKNTERAGRSQRCALTTGRPPMSRQGERTTDIRELRCRRRLGQRRCRPPSVSSLAANRHHYFRRPALRPSHPASLQGTSKRGRWEDGGTPLLPAA